MPWETVGIADRIHDDEFDTSERVARAILAEHHPDLADAELAGISGSGADNRIWRIRRFRETDLVLRLPRTAGAADRLDVERSVLEHLADQTLEIPTPRFVSSGPATPSRPLPWLLLEWIDGEDLTVASLADQTDTARRLGEIVRRLGTISIGGVPERIAGQRGGPLLPLLDRLDDWLRDDSAERWIDVAAVRRAAAQSRSAAGTEPDPVLLHGDLIPGNIVQRPSGALALIDWGLAGIGDPALDLTPAWAVFETSDARQAFRRSIGADDAAWLRGRAMALEQAVGAIVYYRPRRHPLADVMARILERILDDTS